MYVLVFFSFILILFCFACGGLRKVKAQRLCVCYYTVSPAFTVYSLNGQYFKKKYFNLENKGKTGGRIGDYTNLLLIRLHLFVKYYFLQYILKISVQPFQLSIVDDFCSLCPGKTAVIFGQLTYIPCFVKICRCLTCAINIHNSCQVLCMSLFLDGGKGQLPILSNLISVRIFVVLLS